MRKGGRDALGNVEQRPSSKADSRLGETVCTVREFYISNQAKIFSLNVDHLFCSKMADVLQDLALSVTYTLYMLKENFNHKSPPRADSENPPTEPKSRFK